ncbi:MAG: CHAP domain-containing protein [Saprospiraceae bacterium]|nr:CHAP domain-containing protein [Saprospiraceae bacterium]
MKKLQIMLAVSAVVLGTIFSACKKEKIDHLVVSQNETTDLDSDFNPGEIYGQPNVVENRACTVGAQSGSFNGVPAYMNCPIGSSNTYGDSYVGSVYVGKKWQCVEYVQRYYKIVYNLNIKPAFGNANTYWTNNNHSSVGLQKFANGSVAPQVGDILVSTSGSFGHVAIVTGVTSSTVSIIDQNFSSTSQRNITRSGNTIGNFSSGYSVAGLVRKMAPATTPTLVLPAQNATNLLAPINFSWTCPNGTEYRIQIIESTKFQGFSSLNGFSGTMAYNNNIGNILSFIWTNPTKGKTYYWTVRANNSAGQSQFASYRTFTTKP